MSQEVKDIVGLCPNEEERKLTETCSYIMCKIRFKPCKRICGENCEFYNMLVGERNDG